MICGIVQTRSGSIDTNGDEISWSTVSKLDNIMINFEIPQENV